MKTSQAFALRIINENIKIPSEVKDKIFHVCKEEKFDQDLIKSIFYIENYFRPLWFQKIEHLLLRAGLLRDPSIGPFQIKLTNFNRKPIDKEDLVSSSIKYIINCIKKNNLENLSDFRRFGLIYNGTQEYGDVMFEIYRRLKCSVRI